MGSIPMTSGSCAVHPTRHSPKNMKFDYTGFEGELGTEKTTNSERAMQPEQGRERGNMKRKTYILLAVERKRKRQQYINKETGKASMLVEWYSVMCDNQTDAMNRDAVATRWTSL